MKNPITTKASRSGFVQKIIDVNDLFCFKEKTYNGYTEEQIIHRTAGGYYDDCVKYARKLLTGRNPDVDLALGILQYIQDNQ